MIGCNQMACKEERLAARQCIRSARIHRQPYQFIALCNPCRLLSESANNEHKTAGYRANSQADNQHCQSLRSEVSQLRAGQVPRPVINKVLVRRIVIPCPTRQRMFGQWCNCGVNHVQRRFTNRNALKRDDDRAERIIPITKTYRERVLWPSDNL